MKVVKKGIHFTRKTIYVLLTFSVFFLLPFVVITLVTSKSDILSGMKSFVIVSGSMEPSIPTGSIIYTIKKDFYSNKDVIAFRENGRTISHRIIGVQGIGNELYYATKGDANNVEDNTLIAKSEVVGKSVFQIPYLGRIVMAFKTPIGFGIGIVIPSILFIAMELWNIKREIEKETEKKVLERIGAIT